MEWMRESGFLEVALTVVPIIAVSIWGWFKRSAWRQQHISDVTLESVQGVVTAVYHETVRDLKANQDGKLTPEQKDEVMDQAIDRVYRRTDDLGVVIPPSDDDIVRAQIEERIIKIRALAKGILDE